jgi:hypothetical protein
MTKSILKQVLKFEKERPLGTYLLLKEYIDDELKVTPRSVVGHLAGKSGRRAGVEVTQEGEKLRMISGVYRIRVSWAGKNSYYVGESSAKTEMILDRVMTHIHALRYLPHARDFRDLLSLSLNKQLSSQEANTIFGSKKFDSTLEIGDFFISKTKEADKSKYILARKISSTYKNHEEQRLFFKNRVYLTFIPIHSPNNHELLKAATKYLEALALLEYQAILDTEFFLNERNEAKHIKSKKSRFKEMYEASDYQTCKNLNKLYEYSCT